MKRHIFMESFYRIVAYWLLIGLFIHNAYAETPVPTPLTGYASSLPPIYTDPRQQKGSIWGATEVARCPEGYKLSLNATDESHAPEAGSTPSCVPMTATEYSGSLQ